MAPQKDDLAGLHPDHILSCLESFGVCLSFPSIPPHTQGTNQVQDIMNKTDTIFSLSALGNQKRER